MLKRTGISGTKSTNQTASLNLMLLCTIFYNICNQ